MLCVRCQHPLPSGADRCLRCFALNPQNRSAAPARDVELPADDPEIEAVIAPLDSEPPRPVTLSIETDPPVVPSARIAPGQTVSPAAAWRTHELLWSQPPTIKPRLDLLPELAEPPEPVLPEHELGDIELGTFNTEPIVIDDDWRLASAPPPSEAITEPPVAFEDEPPLEEAPTLLSPPPRPQARPREARAVQAPWAPAGKRLLAWAVDGAVLLFCVALFAVVAAAVVGADRLAPPGFASADYWLDLLFSGPRLQLPWLALLGCLALAYSWFFGWAGGRTPGMALTGLRLVRLPAQRVPALPALLRALLALPSAAAGLAGFLLALFDARGQALHDKLTGTAVVRADAPLAADARSA